MENNIELLTCLKAIYNMKYILFVFVKKYSVLPILHIVSLSKICQPPHVTVVGIETRVLENPGKPVHFAKPETRVYDALKPGFRVKFNAF